MQIVIDISEDIYEKFGYEYEENFISKHTNDVILDAFCNSILLPKGHGRLIDEDQIPGDNGWDFSDRLTSTPTIIAADKESKI